MEKPVNSSDKPEKNGISPVKTIAAIVFGVVYIAVLLLIGKFPIILPVALSFLIILAEREYTALVANKGIKTERISLLFFSLLYVWSTYVFVFSLQSNPMPHYLQFLFIFLVRFSYYSSPIMFLSLIVVSSILFLKTRQVPDFSSLFATLFGIIYLGYLFSYFIFLSARGIQYLWLLTILTWAADVGGYIFGKLLGGPKIIPAISPGKTWSGVCGGILLCITVFLVFSNLKLWGDYYTTPMQFKYIKFLMIAPFLIYFSALFGDLFESAMKRYFGVKDTGGLIPEHGGIMDRFDSMLFVAPVLYILFS